MKRNYGIDLLRMVLMLMVLILHILWHGGVLGATEPLSLKYNAGWLLETAAYCAVNCYVLITGYVYINSRYKFSSYVVLWLQVVLYSVGIAACVWLVNPDSFSFRSLLYFLTPVSHNLFWFFSAYTGLFLFIPFLNAAIGTLSQQQIKRFLILSTAAFSILSTFLYEDPFGVSLGYNTIWFIYLYILGACIKKYEWGKGLTARKSFLLYAACVLVSWGVKVIWDSVTAAMGGEVRPSGILISYISPTIVGASIFLLLAFEKMKLSPFWIRATAAFSPAAFGVYLIHTHECVGVHLITEKYRFLADYSTPVMLGGVIAVAAILFMICILVDWVRLRIFKLLRIRERIEALETKFLQ